MKRLLLAPLLIALTGCSTDIVVKTDLGEKYIVKKNTIKVENYKVDDLLRSEESRSSMFLNFQKSELKSVAKYQKDLDYCIEKRGEYFTCPMPEDWLRKKIKYHQEKADKEKQNAEEAVVRFEKLKKRIFKKFKGSEISLVYVYYQPIFQDINNIKTIQEEKLVRCLAPFTSIYFGSSSLRTHTPLEEQLCKKYAKFTKVPFNL